MPFGDDKEERKALKLIAYFPVLVCVGIVGWSYYAFIITLCIPLLERHPTQAVIYLVIYHPLLFLFMWSYAQVVFVHPGTPEPRARSRNGAPVPQRVADIYQPQVAAGVAGASSSTAGAANLSGAPGEFSEGEPDGRLSDVRLSLEMVELSVTVKQNGQQRFCTKCNGEKPDRTHHCRMCGQCILKMDHHCPWINSCVGFRNQKHFVLFISWGAVYCLFVAAATVDRTARMLNDDWRYGSASVEVQWAFLILCGGLFGISLLAFAAYHTYMVLSNQTTIETYQRHVYRIDGDLAPSNHLNLFDVGKRKNWIQVMGEPWYLWFLPISNSPGDGKTWPLSAGHYSALEVDSSGTRLSTA